MNKFLAPLDQRGSMYHGLWWSVLQRLILLSGYLVASMGVFADEHDAKALRGQIETMQQEQLRLKEQMEVLEQQVQEQRSPSQAPAPSSAAPRLGSQPSSKATTWTRREPRCQPWSGVIRPRSIATATLATVNAAVAIGGQVLAAWPAPMISPISK